MRRILGLLLVGCLCSSVVPTKAQPNAPSEDRRAQPPGPAGYVVPDGYDRKHIQVKFLDDLDIGIGPSSWPVGRSGNVLRTPAALGLFHRVHNAGGVWRRLWPVLRSFADSLRPFAVRRWRGALLPSRGASRLRRALVGLRPKPGLVPVRAERVRSADAPRPLVQSSVMCGL